jgi:methionyl-tRNA formyltransferase
VRIVILTSLRKGTASYCLPLLVEQTGAEIVQVIYNEGTSARKRGFYRQKLKKIARIGLLGAINGIRMRKWFSIDEMPEGKIGDIEALCGELGVPFAVTPAINNPRTVELMRAADADLGLSLGNSYIPPKVFTIPRQGMLNIHGEVLPDFQNAQSVIWQLYEGNNCTGYTIHKIEKKIDTGEIIKQERFPIQFREKLSGTVAASCREILRRAARGLVDVIDNFQEYDSRKRPQGAGRSYTTPTWRQFIRIWRNHNKLRKQA